MRTFRPSAIALFSFAGVAALGACSRTPADTYQGYIEGRFVYIASPESGRLERLAVVRGDAVASGHAVFELEQDPEAQAERQARQVLISSQSKLADLKTGKRAAEIAVTRAQWKQAVVQQRQADDILKSDEAQLRAGGLSDNDLINARAAAESGAARVRELEASLSVDALPARRQQLKAQENQVAADQASLAQAQWRLSQKNVAAPRAGLVFDTLYREGDWVAAGSPVVQLLPPENLEIRFFVPEPVVGRLRVGQTVRVACDGCRSPIEATIRFVSPQCEYTPPVIYSNENRSKLVFMIIAQTAHSAAVELHPGQPVTVSL